MRKLYRTRLSNIQALTARMSGAAWLQGLTTAHALKWGSAPAPGVRRPGREWPHCSELVLNLAVCCSARSDLQLHPTCEHSPPFSGGQGRRGPNPAARGRQGWEWAQVRSHWKPVHPAFLGPRTWTPGKSRSQSGAPAQAMAQQSHCAPVSSG